MRDISQLREALAGIPDALQHFPSESESGQLDNGRLSVLWHGEIGGHDVRHASMPDVSRADARAGDFRPAFSLATNNGIVPSLSQNEVEKIAREVELHGIDALAYYVSFHYTGVRWGVHVNLSGLVYMVQTVFGSLPISNISKVELAFQALLDHELFHFACDYAVAQAEIAINFGIRLSFRDSWREGGERYVPLEEELANAYMLRRIRARRTPLNSSNKFALLRDFTKAQPPGYCDGWRVAEKDWNEKLGELMDTYGCIAFDEVDARRLFHFMGVYDWACSFQIYPSVDWRRCPIYIVDDSERSGLPVGWLDAFSCISNLDVSARFLKKLARQPSEVVRAWRRIAQQLATAITPGRDFKRWPPGGEGVYSLRVTDGHRAHLHRRADETWEAIDIGSHREMGHG